MCYAFDSYAGIIENHSNPNRVATELYIVFNSNTVPDDGKGEGVGNHQMFVHYGRIVYINPNPGGGGNM